MMLGQRTAPARTTRRRMGSEVDFATVERLARHAFYLTTRMIFDANNRKDKALGDPKIGRAHV